jgi:hypothetical protein
MRARHHNFYHIEDFPWLPDLDNITIDAIKESESKLKTTRGQIQYSSRAHPNP